MLENLIRFWEFILSLGIKKIIAIVALFFLVSVIPLTVLVSQQRQETRQHASVGSSDNLLRNTSGNSMQNRDVSDGTTQIVQVFNPPDSFGRYRLTGEVNWTSIFPSGAGFQEIASLQADVFNGNTYCATFGAPGDKAIISTPAINTPRSYILANDDVTFTIPLPDHPECNSFRVILRASNVNAHFKNVSLQRENNRDVALGIGGGAVTTDLLSGSKNQTAGFARASNLAGKTFRLYGVQDANSFQKGAYIDVAEWSPEPPPPPPPPPSLDPSSVLAARLVGPITAKTGLSLTYDVEILGNSQILKGEIWVETSNHTNPYPYACPRQKTGSWCNIGTTNVGSETALSTTFSGNWTPAEADTYNVVVNAFKADGIWCSGNPNRGGNIADCGGSSRTVLRVLQNFTPVWKAGHKVGETFTIASGIASDYYVQLAVLIPDGTQCKSSGCTVNYSNVKLSEITGGWHSANLLRNATDASGEGSMRDRDVSDGPGGAEQRFGVGVYKLTGNVAWEKGSWPQIVASVQADVYNGDTFCWTIGPPQTFSVPTTSSGNYNVDLAITVPKSEVPNCKEFRLIERAQNADVHFRNMSLNALTPVASIAQSSGTAGSGNVGRAITFTGTFTNSTKGEIWVTTTNTGLTDYPYTCTQKAGKWCKISTASLNDGSGNATGVWTPTNADSYYVVVNAFNSDLRKCTGNPNGADAEWASCGSSAVVQVNVSTAAAAATNTPTPSPTTPAGVATNTPTPSPTGGAISGTTVSLTLKLVGVGKGQGENQTPVHLILPVEVSLFTTDPNNPIAVGTGKVKYDSQSGKYITDNTNTQTAPVILPPTAATGDYLIKIKMNKYLVKQVNAMARITAGSNNTVRETTLIPGDITGDDNILVDDYSAYQSCVGSKKDTAVCQADALTFHGVVFKKWELTDLNDDGRTDSDLSSATYDKSDFQLLLQNFNQKGDKTP